MFQFLIFAPATGLFILEDERGYNRDHRHFSKILMKCGQSYLNTEGLQSINFHLRHKNMHAACRLPTGSVQNHTDG